MKPSKALGSNINKRIQEGKKKLSVETKESRSQPLHVTLQKRKEATKILW